MREILDALFNDHKDHDVTLSQKVINNLGIIKDQIILKCGGVQVPCIIYSTSMKKARIIAKINSELLEELKRHKNIISLRFTFFEKEQYQTISFYMSSEIVNYEKYDSDKPDLYFFNIEFKRRPPDDFVNVLGSYISEQVTKQKRSEQRCVINSNDSNTPGIKSMETFLFVSGKGKRCVLAEISLYSAKVLTSGKLDKYNEGESAMLIMKSEALKGLGEMVGKIGRVDLINQEEGLFSLIIIFDQDMIPPAYKNWVTDCIKIIKHNPEGK